MKINYINFWDGLDPETFWLTKLLSNHLKEEIIISDDCDILFHSCFGNNIEYQNSKAIKIYCTWENRPEIDKERIKYSDYYFTHWIDDFSGKNFRLPLWYLYIDWWDSSDSILTPNYKNIQSNIFSSEECFYRPNFCSIVASNPVSSRMDMASELTSIDKVVGYGAAFGGYLQENKYRILHDFKFNLCFENLISSGYNTEKLFEAKFSGCIPLYNGDPSGCNLDFNPKSFINYYDYNKENFLQLVRELNQSKSMFDDIHSQNLFIESPSLYSIHNKLNQIIK